MIAKTALVIGVTGQDGAYLSEYLLSKNYTVVGSSRDAHVCDRSRLKALGIASQIQVISIAPTDFRSVLQALIEVQPDEIYNLSGQTSVGLSFTQPIECNDSVSNAVLTLLEAIRFARLNCRLFNAGSSECFGDTGAVPASESTPFQPKSPYGIAKTSAYWHVACFRESYGMFCCTGILGNHDSPLRPDRFVTMKIIKAALSIKAGSQAELRLGRTDIIRDWGWAPDYVQAMHQMLQAANPQDYVIGSGQSASLEHFVDAAFKSLDLDYRNFLIIDPSFSRPNELQQSRLDPALIQSSLGWRSTRSLAFITSQMLQRVRNVEPVA